jgi:thiol reductant ABC exporter CydC subunit
MKPLRRVLRDSGTPKARLALAGVLGMASAAATIGLLAGSGYLVGRAALRPGLDALVGLLAAVEVLAFLRGPLRYAERLVGHDAALRALTRWRVWLYDRLADRVPAAFANWRSGDLLTRAIDDVDALTDLYLRTVLPVAVATGSAVIGTVAVGVILPWAALALGVPILFALVVPTLVLWRQGDAGGADLSGALAAQVVDVIHGAPDLLAFGADRAALARLDALRQAAEAAERRQARANAVATLSAQICLAVAVVTVLALGIVAVHDHHLGRVMVAVLPLAVLGAFEPVPLVTQAVSRALSVRASAERLLALDAVPVPVSDPPQPLSLPDGVPAVAFDQASLRYGAGLPLALDGVSFDIAPGDRIAVTGSSGAGKSSLLNALLRFWPLSGGTLSMGGQPVESLRAADVRAACAVVDQGAHLFAGTLRANLTLGNPGATEEDVADALVAAHLTEWVATLPEGLDTQVGDDGGAVSGGERRRLVVARALLAGGDILVLDEPTNGLDAPLADQLIDDLLAAAGERTVLLVTHREAETNRCHTIVTLENGVVVR